ncbi:tripartite tricarboxylate transporter TctB family protein [Martelella radicis]|uniref:Glucan phosphoethanolaminetransferase (Alkaline phosphatase superfamily) n=1 Tax=Martelella radicis TaxID=1397476 RepID=A0A7W6KGN7_9HYPH|nr:tripartite tricarboxylate transporter TctB family protein [Martelella radicis]MBB4120901.1 glucan phosphoethanolaminetransferase (alkaline phosphatase superfamily) [Martelella radicis]
MAETNRRGAVSRASRAAETAVIAALFLLVIVFTIQTFEEISAFARASQGKGPFFFPRFVLAVMAFLLLLLLPGLKHGSRELPPLAPALKMVALMAATAVYCALMPVIGFLAASVLFAVAVPLVLGRRDIGLLVAVAISYSLAVWLLFERVFLILLPGFAWPL